MGIHWTADCAMRLFHIVGSKDYYYSFFWLECIASPNPRNGIDIDIVSLLKQETIGIVLTGTFPQRTQSGPQPDLDI